MTTTTTPTPKRGDRIRINNIPEDYSFKDLYVTEHRNEGVVTNIGNRVGFMTGYTPYLHDGDFSCSGGGHGAPIDLLKFIETAPANFWRFKNNLPKAHNGETYQLEVNIFEIEFSQLTR